MRPAQPTGLCVRPACAQDALAVEAMASTLSSRSLGRRFMGGLSRSSAASELRRELHPARDHFAFVAADDAGAIVGEAYAARVNADTAEVAFVVTDAWQHHHVGTALCDRLFDALRAAGIRTAIAETFSDNIALRRLLTRHHATREEVCGAGVVRLFVDLTIPHAGDVDATT